jgi:hypothetical protein
MSKSVTAPATVWETQITALLISLWSRNREKEGNGNTKCLYLKKKKTVLLMT